MNPSHRNTIVAIGCLLWAAGYAIWKAILWVLQ